MTDSTSEGGTAAGRYDVTFTGVVSANWGTLEGTFGEFNGLMMGAVVGCGWEVNGGGWLFHFIVLT